MARTSQSRKEDHFNFRLDPALKVAFTRATEADAKPAAQVIRDLMRGYVQQREQQIFTAEARRQSIEAAACARDPASDEHVSLQEYAAFLDEDHFADTWKA